MMSRTRLLLLLGFAALAVSTGLTGEARAQNFFERLFGIRPAPAPVPPGAIPQRPGVPGPGAPGVAPLDPAAPDAQGVPPAPQHAPPAPPKPIVLKAPSEDSIVGRDLKLNGSKGSLRVERAGAELRAQVTLQGSKASNPVESCSVDLGKGGPLTLTSAGKPEGVPRYSIDAPACPISFDVLDGAVMVNASAPACTIKEADCEIDPRGLWGPEPGALLPQAASLEDARGQADRAVRENYKALVQRAGPQNTRPVVSEQAAFTSEREQTCRWYAREGAHGFCNVRFTEARALSLAARLGLNASAAAAPAAPRPRRPPPTQADYDSYQAPQAPVARNAEPVIPR